ncbi:integration host factor subunit alpha [Candidatus Kinetoplastidibacterium crithidiae]|uniref:Integration host factor subunit alpha n=1 Tax=Candidatus Kinetoplastidibacterium crithidiae TCC036E TaxID=1208918 RepID=M1LWI1_9PROT|nr:integration host factor subunit alpha [Candidatus Kinetoplastibacterium crithidii]AFZ82765.1 integration host factor subunit alpha [Candidatus Kinetoplastibacterium crithidii (ex Angomonas deanei ATCC 30255)]AGF47584.1 integration host factor subunit alpha [Candidatus Kinetoplastibacterium crithidii TCC036E]
MSNSNTFTKSELIDLVFERVGLNRSISKNIVDSFFEEIRSSLANGKEVKLSGFGNFSLLDKEQRPGRNPKTGIPTVISARRVVTFRPSKILKRNINI